MFIVDEGNTLKLVAEENFSHTFAEALHAKLQESMQNVQAKDVVLDMTQVELLDSIGVKLLVGLYRTCQEQSLGFSVDVAHQSVYKVLRLCRLDQLIEIREAQGGE